MKTHSIGYQKRLLIYLMLGGLLPLLLASAMILYTADSVYDNIRAKSGRTEAQRISGEIDNLVGSYERLMNPLLVRRETVDFLRGSREDVEHIYENLYAILAGHAGEASIYLLSADGRQVIATDDVPRSYALPENLRWGILGQANEAHDWVAAAADKYAADRSEVVFSMAHAIRSGDELLGFAVIDIKREALVPLIQRAQEGREGQIILTDRYQYVMLNMRDHRQEGFLSVRPTNETQEEPLFRDYMHTSRNTAFCIHLRQYVDRSPLDYLVRLIVIVDAVAFCVTAYLAYRLSRRLWQPLHMLTTAMRRVRNGNDFSVRVDIGRSDEIGELALTFNGLVDHVRTLLAENRARERRLRIAQVKSLTEMIRPHFIYNTLNLIKWSAKLGDSEGAADTAVQLGKLLRASVNMKEFVTVADELAFLRTYLKIQQRRFEGRLNVSMRVDVAIHKYYVPKLILQPLVENAIQHGLEGLEHGGSITIAGGETAGYLIFRVADDGQGIPPERRREILERRDDNRFGLYNVHMRAVLNGDERCGIQLHSAEGEGTEAVLTLKAWEEAPHYD
ncbi:sensor histidine kinase [Selenomonas sp. F0473]|uniref:sensor histidine kinase n=1 Tax=Selenomonas sp. F0473 TaxID=999423 RepID=UPI00029E8A1D|nr:sensor histidine kinase [Selenomonas sp. F0473]EKU71904.1 hypothetical protein HMPREF9161_00589 [Selenomonas sp. F0473]